jgi:hypothetical protein
MLIWHCMIDRLGIMCKDVFLSVNIKCEFEGG